MRIAQIRTEDISNGPGIRMSIFVQGCTHHCDGCFSPQTWDFNKGWLFTEKIKNMFIELARNKKITGFSILGGEPLLQGEDMLKLIQEIKKEYEKEKKTIWMWTGFKYENLNEEQMEIVKLVDVLVDGPFIKELRCPKKRFRGSSNQRIIDIQKTLKSNKIIIHELQN